MAKKCGECKGTGQDPATRDRDGITCPDCMGTGNAMQTFSVEVVRYYSVTLRAKNSRDASYVATGKVRLVRD